MTGTANTVAHQVAGNLEPGMDAHVAKPFQAAVLFKALETVAGGREP